jgi:hypothetical protein
MRSSTQCFAQFVKHLSFGDSSQRHLRAPSDFYEVATTGNSATLELVLDGDLFDRLYELNTYETRDALNNLNVTLLRGTISWAFGL